MSLRSATACRVGKQSREVLWRSLATPGSSASPESSTASSSSSSSSSSSPPRLQVALILSRHPLIRKLPSTLQSTYHAHTSALRQAISNPIPENVYFSQGSLAHRRYQKASYEHEEELFGPALAGKEPAVGDIPPERPLEILDRDHWVKADAKRGEKSLERCPDEEVFCMVQEKEAKKWTFPSIEVAQNDRLHAVVEGLTGPEGVLNGKTMDTWLVTKKPVGFVNQDGARTFFMRSHILGGEPKLPSSAPWNELAWLNLEELERRLRAQGDEAMWENVKGVFGVPPIPVPDVAGVAHGEI